MEKSVKKAKTPQIITVVSFVTAIAVLFVLFVVLPKKAGQMSDLEFRKLEDHPIIGKSFSTIVSDTVRGDLSKNVDSFLEDHFPARNLFIALNAYYLRLTGRNADQGIVLGKNGRLFDAAIHPDMEQLDKNIDGVLRFAEDNGLALIYVDVPTSAAVVTEDLPDLHLEYHDAEVIAHIRERVSQKGQSAPDLISLYGDDAGEYFYRTDHHWTMKGAYLCYAAIANDLGITPVKESQFVVTGHEFYGSFYRKAGLWLTEPDALEVWRCDETEAMKVTIGSGDKSVEHTGLYDDEQLRTDNVNKYAAYIYDNNGLTVIENEAGNGETLLVVKDSFGNSIVPLLAMNYSRVVMIDTREYRDASLPAPSELVNLYGITQMVVVLGTDSSTSNITIGFLR